MTILILLGKDGRYLDYKKFKSEDEMNIFIEKIHPLVLANIDGVLPLQKRLELLPKDVEYFVYAGAVWDFDWILEE